MEILKIEPFYSYHQKSFVHNLNNKRSKIEATLNNKNGMSDKRIIM